MKKSSKEKAVQGLSPAEEAQRYLDNAKEILSEKAGKEDGYYQDTKYVKLAGHAAYAVILVALDAYLGRKRRVENM